MDDSTSDEEVASNASEALSLSYKDNDMYPESETTRQTTTSLPEPAIIFRPEKTKHYLRALQR